MCWDYRDLDFDAGVLEGYSTTRVLAWSMGVWVAGQVLSGMDMAPGYRVAVNGTPFPIHDSLGIPEAVFDGTLGQRHSISHTRQLRYPRGRIRRDAGHAVREESE